MATAIINPLWLFVIALAGWSCHSLYHCLTAHGLHRSQAAALKAAHHTGLTAAWFLVEATAMGARKVQW